MNRYIALVDWDGTIRRDFTIRSWMKYLSSKHYISTKSINELEYQFNRYVKKEINHDVFAGYSSHIYAKSLKGKYVKDIRDVAQKFYKIDISNLMRLPFELLTKLKKLNIEPIIISGAPSEILLQYQKQLCLKQIFCLDLIKMKGKFTGSIKYNPGISTVKRDIVAKILSKCNTQVKVSIGNSDSDMPIFNVSPVNVIIGNSNLHLFGRSVFRLRNALDFKKVVALLK